MAILDRWLRRRQGVFEYSSTRECLFRTQRTDAAHYCCLEDGSTIHPGAAILTLHVWNDHVPAIGADGPTIGWARRFAGALDFSLGELARFLRERPDFSGIAGIRIEMGMGMRGPTNEASRF